MNRTTDTPTVQGGLSVLSTDTPSSHSNADSFGLMSAMDDTFSKLSDNPDATARSLVSGEFDMDGTGTLGNLYREMATLTGKPLEDAWSNVLELCDKLWEEEKHKAALKLIQTAHDKLIIPDVFLMRVNSAVYEARNETYVIDAEKHFKKGDYDSAMEIANNVEGAKGEEYRADLTERNRVRLRVRKISFSVTGLLILALLLIAFNGAVGFIDYVKDPYVPKLPSLPQSGLWNDLKETPLTENPFPDVSPAISPGKTGLSLSELSERDYSCVLGIASSRRALKILSEIKDPTKVTKAKDFIDKVKRGCASLDMSQTQLEDLISQLPKDKVDVIAKNLTETSR